MNTLLKKFVPGLLVAICLAGSASAQTRIAVLSTQKVLDSYWKTKQADAVLKDQLAEMEKTNKEMLDNWKKAKEDHQKLVDSVSDQTVSPAERDKRKAAAEDKFKEIKSLEDNITMFQRQVSATIGERKTRLRKNLLDDIKQVVSSKAKAGGYALVIDADAQTFVPDPIAPFSTPAILFTSGEYDLTDAVIAQLNAAAPIDTSKPDEKKPEPKDTKK